MTEYRAPVGDINFTLNHVCDYPTIASLPGNEHADPDTAEGLLEEAGRFMAQVLAPLNPVGDKEGVKWNPDYTVTTATGFISAYEQYVDAGWGAVPFPSEYGGGAFPWVIALALQELMTSSNLSFSMCPLLTQGAIDALLHHGSETLKETWLPNMVSGKWTGTMNLTEPDAGSDVGALRTTAKPVGDGTYLVSGQKIFISFGEHDMAENIVHLVLARTPDAPPGTKGISLFVVPKFLINDDGSLADRNDVRCLSVEHKLGIHASPTCVLEYGGASDGAVGYLVGEENHGMAYMFTMMNQARLSVGLQGLALSERAYQQALTFAQERHQGRAIGAPPGTSSPIFDHPDVRRMLMTMRSSMDAMRALLYANAEAIDFATHHPDEDIRTINDERAALYTPLSKSWCTDLSIDLTGLAIQIHGGMGFIEETGVAQHYRDARIATIYEGTNGIQAMDLVGRKLPMRMGGVINDHYERLDSLLAEAAKVPALVPAVEATQSLLSACRDATQWIFEHAAAPADVLAGATPFQRMLAVVTAGTFLLKGAASAHAAGTPDAPNRVASAAFFGTQILPTANGHLASVKAGIAPLMELDAEALASR